MDFNDFKNRRINILKEIDTLANYDFYTTIVSLDSCSSIDMEKITEHKDKLLKIINSISDTSTSINLHECQDLIKTRLIIHEYTHFIDCTSTLWGMNYLKSMMNAYESDDREFGEKEENFYLAKQFNHQLRFARLPKYYTYIPENPDHLPWSMQFTIGKIFNHLGEIGSKPILFVRFINDTSNPKTKLIVRSPISLISILECSAMAQEIDFKMKLIKNIQNEDEKCVELTIYNDELKKYIYNKNLTEYSVCVHFLSKKLGSTDIYLTYKIAALICRFVLNFPKEAYKKVIENYDFSIFYPDIPKSYKLEKFYPDLYLYIESIKKGLEYCDPSFLYHLICELIPENLANLLDDDDEKIESSINNLLNKTFIDLIQIDLNKIQEEELKILMHEIEKTKIQEIKDLANFGYENFQKIQNNTLLPFLELNLPSVLLNDSSEYLLFSDSNNKMANYNIDKLYNSLIKGQLWVERFTEACE